MNNITIRLAEAKDWDAAMGVAWITFQQIAEEVSSPEGRENFKEGLTSTQAYINFLQGGCPLFCAYHGRKVVGMLTLGGEAHISLLFVKKEFQRRGIGTGLIKTCISYCRERGAHTLTVHASAGGIPFYESNGFEIDGVEQLDRGIKYTPMILRG